MTMQAGTGSPLSEEQFKRALTALSDDIKPRQLDMLKAHYHAPDRRMTAAQLASAGGYQSYVSSNSRYGALARKIAEHLGYEPERRRDGTRKWTTTIAVGHTGLDGGQFQWELRPQFARALKALGIV